MYIQSNLYSSLVSPYKYFKVSFYEIDMTSNNDKVSSTITEQRVDSDEERRRGGELENDLRSLVKID